MKFLVLKFSVVFLIFNLELNLAQILKWKSLTHKDINELGNPSFKNIDNPKNLIIFIVNKKNLRSNEIQRYGNEINYALEPYKSFLSYHGHEMRSKDKKSSRDSRSDRDDFYSKEKSSDETSSKRLKSRAKKGRKRKDVKDDDDSGDDTYDEISSEHLKKKRGKERDDTYDVISSEQSKKPEKRGEEKDVDDFSKEALGGLKLTKEQTEMLRKRWRSSCDKKAAKQCRKACNVSYKNVCRSYRCFRSQKRSFKRECSWNCKRKFRGQR